MEQPDGERVSRTDRYPSLSPIHGEVNIEKELSPIQQFQQIPKNSLDQDICQTFGREFKGMCYKFGYVLIPRSSGDGTNRLRNWDLWGPFFICLIFGVFINSTFIFINSLDSNQFILLFFSVFGGALIVTFNTRVLGGKISFFQSVAVLGYCIFPLFIATIILVVMKFFNITSTVVKMIVVVVGCLWCILSARAFISVNVGQDRKFVAMYPICLFYIFLAVLLIYM